MRLRHGFLSIAFVALIAFAPADAQDEAASRAQTSADSLAATLALPISPASIALLVGNGADPAAQQRVREALEDAQPAVRQMAARVIYSAGLRMLIPSLRAALKAEQEDAAGAEEVRALMTLSPPLAAECVTAAGRLGESTATSVAYTFARLGSPDLIAQLPALETAHAESTALRSALLVLIDADGALRERLLRERATDPLAIETALGSYRKAKQQPPDDLLLPLLKAEADQSSEVRTIVAWQFARATAAKTLTPTPAIAAALEARQGEIAEAVTWEALGFELVARAAKRPRHERRWTDLPVQKNVWNHGEDHILIAQLLSKQELADVASAMSTNPEALTSGILSAGAPVKMSKQDDFLIRTAPRILDGLESELLRVTGCEPQPRRMAFANIAWRPDGRPREIVLGKDDRLPEACQRAARTLFSLTLPWPAKPIPPAYGEALVLSLEPDHLACVNEPPAARKDPPPSRVGDKIKAPTRIKNVTPIYPEGAQKERVEGIVIVEAHISTSGCVNSAMVMSSPDTRLSGAALLAVMGWRYSQTLINDVPAPVIMTVAVNFTLQR